jgi:uncharacterized protein (DUF885 family)
MKESRRNSKRNRRSLTVKLAVSVLAFSLYPFASGQVTQRSQTKNEMAAADFPQLVEEYLLDLHSRRPAIAAASGLHAWDGRLEDYSAGAVASEIASIKRFQSRIEKIPPLELSLSDLCDYQILASNMKARLLELEEVRSFERNPQIYSDAISTGLLQIAIFEYAPLDLRLKAVIAKQREVPRLLDSARANVRRVPPVLLKTALESFRGTLAFVQGELPKAFASVRDAKLQSDFKKSTRAAAKAIADYIGHLESKKPDPSVSFALGRENYEAKLRYEEGIDMTVDALLKIAYRELLSTQEQFRRAAAEIDRRRNALAVWAEVQKDHPRAGALVAEAEKQLDALRRFIEEKKIVTLPSGPGPVVGPTPDFMRWASASMWTSGPFESRPLVSRYLITDVDPRWNAKQQEEYLASINRWQLWTTSIHEAYPGHFVQGAYLSKVQSKVRKTWALAPASFVEGWAHYAEQMMIEEGFGEGDPRMKLGLYADALLRLCRFVVGIRLHTGGMTVDDATRFFIDNAYMGETPARIEAERGTFDPTYLVYSVGKLAILKLREDYRRYRGDDFSLQEFHDQVLANGNATVRIHRQMLMPGDRGKLIE